MQEGRLGISLTRRETIAASLAGGVVLAAGGLVACGSDSDKTSTGVGSDTAPKKPKRGGTLRVGMLGNSSDIYDPHVGSDATVGSYTYVKALHDTLLQFDHEGKPQLALAEELTVAPDAMSWTVRLREGVTFHNGKPITLDDVIFSIRRIINPKNGASSALRLGSIDPNGFRKRDARTLEIGLKRRDVTLDTAFAVPVTAIVPTDYDAKKPVGAGAFKLRSFSPGQRVVFDRFENYYKEGQPYLDTLVFVVFRDKTAYFNALNSGAIDAAGTLSPEHLPLAKQNRKLQVVSSHTGVHEHIVMRCDQGAFEDVRVRQAMKLMVDREQLVNQVYGGLGRIGNDLGAAKDPLYASDIPQREQDLEQARALLKAAGKEGMKVTFYTTPATSTFVPAAEVFAEQAKAVGVNVSINNIADVGQYYTKYHGNTDLQQDYLITVPLWSVVGLSYLPNGPYNTMHWNNPEAAKLFIDARGTLDEAKRKEMTEEAQRIFWSEGGWIIWGFPDIHDAISTKFTGVVQDVEGSGINGGRFHEVGLAA